MTDQLSERLALLSKLSASPSTNKLLSLLQRGIEKESLRITNEGKLAQTPHPELLGSALTHPHITTDFSEALLEFITPVHTDINQTLDFLRQVHTAGYAGLKNEQLWGASMPCMLNSDDQIPLARFGNSNVARMKTVYRNGLGHRYGRTMQTIAGIHYNFSIPEQLWQSLQQQDYDKRPLQDYITESYFKLIRNFRRYSWLFVYLYGASPIVCKSFINGQDHKLQDFDNGSLYLPHATSLRMGDLGYQSSAQESLKICYNSLDNYIETLRQAITNTHPDYEKVGTQTNGEYHQLSTALLQIENEFYSTIRPKRVAQSGEIPLGALKQRGVEYIEVRCIDVNPYLPLGIDADQVRFLDCFLLYCLFKRSPDCDDDDRNRINGNLKQVVSYGRDPKLILQTREGDRSLVDWGSNLLQEMQPIAEMLDQANECEDYQRVIAEQQNKIYDSSLTPSAKILHDIKAQEKGFLPFALELAQQHKDFFKQQGLSPEQERYFSEQAALSIKQHATTEATDQIPFEDYLANYYKQYDQLK